MEQNHAQHNQIRSASARLVCSRHRINSPRGRGLQGRKESVEVDSSVPRSKHLKTDLKGSLDSQTGSSAQLSGSTSASTRRPGSAKASPMTHAVLRNGPSAARVPLEVGVDERIKRSPVDINHPFPFPFLVVGRTSYGSYYQRVDLSQTFALSFHYHFPSLLVAPSHRHDCYHRTRDGAAGYSAPTTAPLTGPDKSVLALLSVHLQFCMRHEAEVDAKSSRTCNRMSATNISSHLTVSSLSSGYFSC